jgi:signal transduction histidine kinase
MRNWYKMPVTKGILVLLEHIMVVSAVLSMAVLLTFSGNLEKADFFNFSSKTYEESAGFKNMVYNATWNVMESINIKRNFETDGKYNPDKQVDIIKMGKSNEITGENISGLAYTVENLQNWSNEYQEEGANYEGNNIVVCEKPDGTYYYYYMSEFRTLVEDKKLNLEVDNRTTSDYLKDLEDGYYTYGYYDGSLIIKDAEGNTKYTDCWTFNEAVKEKYAPVGASNILEVVNNTPELNGKMSKVFDYLESTLSSFSSQLDQYLYEGDTWSEGNTNFTYILVNANTKTVYTNNSKYKNYDDVKENLEALKDGKNNQYLIVRPKLAEFETNMDISASEWRSMVKSYTYEQCADCIFAASVNTEFPIQDSFYTDAQNYDTYAPYLKMAATGSIFCSITFLLILLWLTVISGRNSKDEVLHLTGFDGWKTELGAIFVILIWIIPVLFMSNVWGGSSIGITTYDYYQGTYSDTYYGNYLNIADLVVAGIIAAYTTTCFLIGYLSLIRRIKARGLWKNSLFKSFIELMKELWIKRGVIFKVVWIFVAFVVIHWFALAINSPVSVPLLFIVEGAAGYFVIKNAIAKSLIKKGIQEIASGNVDYQIPLKGLRGDNLYLAEMVNNIGNGLQRAVEEGMKSERLKTDLITNVSHDIKTPLTSIINYVDLLKRENFTDTKIQGYLDILEAKAQRLKTLTEDVVEASKVSSGNIELEMMDVNLVEMIHQTAGEFAEKFEKKNLEIIQNISDTSAMIHVDGRCMWRIVENIYNNTAKYAMPGTRVYTDLWMDDEQVRFSLKNISEQPLNISADELTERFIRGDLSRSTEGSGLGLSIAKSLTQMQGGEFSLYLDGDLFKVTIAFPRVKK